MGKFYLVEVFDTMGKFYLVEVFVHVGLSQSLIDVMKLTNAIS